MGSDHSQRQTNLEAGHFDVVRHGDENYRSQLQESFEPADRVNLHMINRVTCNGTESVFYLYWDEAITVPLTSINSDYSCLQPWLVRPLSMWNAGSSFLLFHIKPIPTNPTFYLTDDYIFPLPIFYVDEHIWSILSEFIMILEGQSNYLILFAT